MWAVPAQSGQQRIELARAFTKLFVLEFMLYIPCFNTSVVTPTRRQDPKCMASGRNSTVSPCARIDKSGCREFSMVAVQNALPPLLCLKKSADGQKPPADPPNVPKVNKSSYPTENLFL